MKESNSRQDKMEKELANIQKVLAESEYNNKRDSSENDKKEIMK